MALTNASYLGDGVNSLFSVSFPYLSKAHVKVFVDGVEDISFTWTTSASITTTTVPANGAIVFIKRVSPTAPLVDFVDGSTLTENLLDTSTVQSLYVAEESRDNLSDTLQKDTLDNTWDGDTLRIKNVVNPVDPQDVATKSWSESAVTTSVNQAASSASNANTSAVNAAASASTATTQAGIATTQAGIATTKSSEATTQAGIATTKAGEANTSAVNAADSASTATVKAGEADSALTLATTQAGIATTKAGEANTSANTAVTKAGEANTSAVNAADSAAAAALVAGSYTLATQAEAEAGVENVKYLSSLRVKQAISANVSPAFPPGTRMPFNQTSAPTGWTKVTTAALNDSIMRIVTATVGSGGSTAFSTFNEQTSVGATTLSTAQIPSHTHTLTTTNTSGASYSAGRVFSETAALYGINVQTARTGILGNEGGGGSHTHTLTHGIKYNDFIIASKD
jgi:microcystin-dependent protein